MIVQVTQLRDELPLIKSLLPIWKKYADGFVFRCHDTSDGTIEFLESVKDQYNILEIMDVITDKTKLLVETDGRQELFNTAHKFTKSIICLDADEYLDGTMSKLELEAHLNDNQDTTFLLQWIQYTGRNTIRVDGPWRVNFKDRIGEYTSWRKFNYAQRHSSHLPLQSKILGFKPEKLFVSHVPWLDKLHSAIKQYYWKITDYVTKLEHKVGTYAVEEYDKSVNNFNWEEEQFYFPLKISPKIFDEYSLAHSYKLCEISSLVNKYSIPYLGDWGYGIHNNHVYLTALQNEIQKLSRKPS